MYLALFAAGERSALTRRTHQTEREGGRDGGQVGGIVMAGFSRLRNGNREKRAVRGSFFRYFTSMSRQRPWPARAERKANTAVCLLPLAPVAGPVCQLSTTVPKVQKKRPKVHPPLPPRSCLSANEPFLDPPGILSPTFNVGKQVKGTVSLTERSLARFHLRLCAFKVSRNKPSGYVTFTVPHSWSHDHQPLEDFRIFNCILSFPNCGTAKPIQGDGVTLTELYSFISSFIFPSFLLLTGVRFLMGKKKKAAEKMK